MGSANNDLIWVGLRFQDVKIPTGATIHSAAIRLTAAESNAGNLIMSIIGERIADASPFSNDMPIIGRSLTDAFVNWSVDPWL